MPPHPDRLALTIDYAFKKFFVTNPGLLLHFLNTVLATTGHPEIVELHVQNPDLPGPSIEDKKAVLDILARDNQGRIANVEMQAFRTPAFTNRAALYAFRLYSSGLAPGADHGDAPPIFSINLLDFVYFPGHTQHRCFRLLDIREPAVEMDVGMEFHFLELPKLKRTAPDSDNLLDTWLEFIGRAPELTEDEMEKLVEKDPIFTEAARALDELSMDSQTRLEYDKRQIAIHFYELNLRKEREAGLAEGNEIGEARGRAAGLEEGRVETQLRTARKMKEHGHSKAHIAEITGLSQAEVEAL